MEIFIKKDKMVEISYNTRETENEKYEYVSGKFIRCVNSFNGFSKGETYWLEYINDDIYVGRSDNILNKKFHITPKQLFQNFILMEKKMKSISTGKKILLGIATLCLVSFILNIKSAENLSEFLITAVPTFIIIYAILSVIWIIISIRKILM